MRSIFALSTGRRQLAEGDLPVAQAWAKVQAARAAICDHFDERASKAAELRAAAGLTKEAVLLGMGNHFELWDAATYAAQEAEAMQGEMPDVLKDFSF